MRVEGAASTLGACEMVLRQQEGFDALHVDVHALENAIDAA